MSKSGRRVFREAEKKNPWWQRSVEEHPFRTLNLGILGIGGAQLLIYFAHIGQLPDVNLASSTSILAAVALLGLTMCIAFGGSVVAAGVLYLNAGNDKAWLRTQESLVLASIPGLTVTLGLIGQAQTGIEFVSAASIQPLAIGMCVLLGDLRVYQLVRSGALSAVAYGPRKGQPLLWDIGTFVFYSYAWALFMGLGAMVFIAMIPHGAGLARSAMALMAWLVISTAINLDFARSTPVANQAKKLIVMAGIGAVLMVTLTQNYSGVAVASVRALGIGAVPVKLVLTMRGCQIANASSSDGPICVADETAKIGIVCPAVLLSKIGTPFFFGVTPFTASGGWPLPELPSAIPIPSAEVLSWPKINPLVPTPQSDAASSASSSAEGAIARIATASQLDDRKRDWLQKQCGRNLSPRSATASAASAASAP